MHHPAHLAQCGHGVGHVLEHLMGVDDVEGGIGEGQGVHVAADQFDGVRQPPRLKSRPRRLERGGGAVECDDAAGGDGLGEVGGDGCGAAADVEQSQARPEMREEIGGGIGRGAVGVAGEDGGGVPVGVAGVLGAVLGIAHGREHTGRGCWVA